MRFKVFSNKTAIRVRFGEKGALKDFFEQLLNNGLTLPNEISLFGRKVNGSLRSLIRLTRNNDIEIGKAGYDGTDGNTKIHGKDVELFVISNGEELSHRPYYKTGDSFEVTVRTAGYVTNGGKDVMFVVPLAKPILENVIVSASTNKGAILRQAGKYTHGCTSNTNTVPDSYTVYKQNIDSICVRCHFTDITNAINNDVIGVQWNGIITFE